MEKKLSRFATFPESEKWEQATARVFYLYQRQNDSRSPFLRDYTRIIHSSSFRRLKHKTQVFFSPQSDHICTRIEHVLHVESIANTIAEVLPVRISEIINGATMEVVDSAIPDVNKIAPSITKYTAVGLMLGVLISAIILVVMALMDDTIHDEEYILRTYDYPILGKVPNLLNSGNKSYSYYAQNQRKTGH